MKLGRVCTVFYCKGFDLLRRQIKFDFLYSVLARSGMSLIQCCAIFRENPNTLVFYRIGNGLLNAPAAIRKFSID
jgi:hypothetical protein